LPFYQRFQKPLCQYNLDNYRRFGKIYGIYEGGRPVLSVAVPELIRDICVKDFNVFVDRLHVSFGDPLFDRSLVTAKGEQWKQIRTIVLMATL
jgi:cytochrome P450 family 3 subfamily A